MQTLYIVELDGGPHMHEHVRSLASKLIVVHLCEDISVEGIKLPHLQNTSAPLNALRQTSTNWVNYNSCKKQATQFFKSNHNNTAIFRVGVASPKHFIEFHKSKEGLVKLKAEPES